MASIVRGLGKLAAYAATTVGKAIDETLCGAVSLTVESAEETNEHRAKGGAGICATTRSPTARAKSPSSRRHTLSHTDSQEVGSTLAGIPEDKKESSSAALPSGVRTVSHEECGAILPPVVIGNPSPAFEPRPVEAGRYLGASLRPAIVADGWTSDDFAVRAASVRGLSHQWYGLPRQDDYVLALTRAGWLVAGVADGVSAVEQSHIASSEVLQYLVGWFAATNPQSIDEVDWQTLVEMIRWDLVEKERRVCPDVEMPGRQLATTISFAVLVPRVDGKADVTVVGVGDSSCMVLDRNGFDRKLGGKEEDEGGISDSTVKALPLLPERVTPTTFVLGPGQVLLLGTDGVGDPLGDGNGEVGALLSDVLLPPVLPSPLAFARIVDFSRETFDDDRTLIAVRLTGCGSELAPGGEEGDAVNEGEYPDSTSIDAEATDDVESNAKAAGTAPVTAGMVLEEAEGTISTSDGTGSSQEVAIRVDTADWLCGNTMAHLARRQE